MIQKYKDKERMKKEKAEREAEFLKKANFGDDDYNFEVYEPEDDIQDQIVEKKID